MMRHPFTCMVTGPTGVGKTQWTKKLVNYASTVIDPPPERIIWCYTVWQPAYEGALEGQVEFTEDLPQFKDLQESSATRKLLILDDKMVALSKDERLVELFTVGAHHWNCSVVHINQSIFYNGLRTARINAHYIVILKCPADKLQIANLARQMYPGKTKFFMEAYNDAVSQPYGYLFVDCSPFTPDDQRIVTNIFPPSFPTVYVAK